MEPDFLSFLTNWNGQTPDSMSTSMEPASYQAPVTADLIQQMLGAKQPDQGGTIKDILSSRFADETGPSYTNYAQSAISSLHDKYTPANELAATDITSQLKGITDLSRAQYYMGGGSGKGGNSVFAQRMALLEADPATKDLPKATLMSMAASGIGQGQTYGSNGYAPITGAPEAAGKMQFGKTAGGEAAKLQFAAPIAEAIARGTVAGKGELTPIELRDKGQNQVSSMIGTIGGYYDALDKAGGAVNPKNTAGQNFSAFLGNTGPGQLQGKMAGTATQSIRNNIEQSRPLLINAIRQATGMSAKAMDSNAELQFYLKAATDPTLDVKANKDALQMLDKLYGLSSNGQTSTAPANPTASGAPLQIKDDSEYDSLPSGAQFIAPDGSHRTKP